MLIAERINLRTILLRMVYLIDLLRREVADIDVGREFGLEWRADLTKVVPEDALEESMGFDIRGGAKAASGGW